MSPSRKLNTDFHSESGSFVRSYKRNIASVMVHLTRSGWLYPVRERQKYYSSIVRKEAFRWHGVRFTHNAYSSETTNRSSSDGCEEEANAFEYICV